MNAPSPHAAARRQRATRILTASAGAFAAAWVGIFAQLVSGDDPALAKSRHATSQPARSTAPVSSSSSAGLSQASGSSQSSGAGSSQASGSSSSPAGVTTQQS